jgi:hypothetical protein
MFGNLIKAPSDFENALVQCAKDDLTTAGWEQLNNGKWRRPDGQEFTFLDAVRVLSGLPALECGTRWPSTK